MSEARTMSDEALAGLSMLPVKAKAACPELGPEKQAADALDAAEIIEQAVQNSILQLLGAMRPVRDNLSYPLHSKCYDVIKELAELGEACKQHQKQHQGADEGVKNVPK